MSRFFRQAGDSDSESEESDEELMSSGGEDDAPARPTGPSAKPVMSRFLKKAGSGSSSSSNSDSDSDSDSDDSDGEGGSGSSEEERTVVKSAMQKRLDEMEATGKVMDNGLRINDWVAISNGELQSAFLRACVDTLQNSTNWLEWCNDKTTSQSPYHHSTSALYPVSTHPSLPPLRKKKSPKRK